MTHDGVIYLLELIDIAYGRARHDMTRQEMERTINLYMDVMSDIPDKLAAYALKQCIKTNKYPPRPAEILEKARIAVESRQDGGDELYIRESWEAIQGSRKFEELSDVGKEYWRSQKAIDAVGFDNSTVYTVFRGQMMRALPGIKERIRVRGEMPQSVRDEIDRMIAEPGAVEKINVSRDAEKLPGELYMEELR